MGPDTASGNGELGATTSASINDIPTASPSDGRLQHQRSPAPISRRLSSLRSLFQGCCCLCCGPGTVFFEDERASQHVQGPCDPLPPVSELDGVGIGWLL